jgi:hypothetical protein
MPLIEVAFQMFLRSHTASLTCLLVRAKPNRGSTDVVRACCIKLSWKLLLEAVSDVRPGKFGSFHHCRCCRRGRVILSHAEHTTEVPRYQSHAFLDKLELNLVTVGASLAWIYIICSRAETDRGPRHWQLVGSREPTTSLPRYIRRLPDPTCATNSNSSALKSYALPNIQSPQSTPTKARSRLAI